MRKDKIDKGDCGWKRSGVTAMSVVFCLSAGEALAQCAVPPTCESLGYSLTATDCEGKRSLKCPFDANKVFCLSNNASNAKIGDIYYSDGTISDSVIAGKTPVGIVAYSDGNEGFVISLEDTYPFKWSSPDYSNSSCLPDLEMNRASADMNGQSNTACILSEKSSGNTYPAAEYCNNYKPVSTGKGSSGWYLPAAGEWGKIGLRLNDLNLQLKRLSKEELPSGSCAWTSTEYNNNSAWAFCTSNNSLSLHTTIKTETSLRGYYLNVRCVLAF